MQRGVIFYHARKHFEIRDPSGERIGTPKTAHDMQTGHIAEHKAKDISDDDSAENDHNSND